MKLAGINEDVIYRDFSESLTNGGSYDKMDKASNPYGDGYTIERIADILEEKEPRSMK